MPLCAWRQPIYARVCVCIFCVELLQCTSRQRRCRRPIRQFDTAPAVSSSSRLTSRVTIGTVPCKSVFHSFKIFASDRRSCDRRRTLRVFSIFYKIVASSLSDYLLCSCVHRCTRSTRHGRQSGYNCNTHTHAHISVHICRCCCCCVEQRR